MDRKIFITVLIVLTFFLMFALFLFSTGNTQTQINNQGVIVQVGESQKVNINTATLDELKSLQGIGDKKAQDIIDNRPYESIYDTLKVSGIGKITINNNKERMVVE